MKEVAIKLLLLITLCVLVGLLIQDDLHAGQLVLDELIATATRTETPRGYITNSVTVITQDDIERRHVSTLHELLREVPGIDVVNYGGPGKSTHVSVRGGEPAHTLVLIDGVRVNSATTGRFEFGDMLVDDIERIEIVRGPLNSLYGSDAFSSVIQIYTKKARTSSASISFEDGSYGTTREGISTAINKDRYDLSLNASHMDVNGFSAISSGSERDGYQNTTISSNLGISLSPVVRFDILARLTESKSDLDSPDFNPNLISDDLNYSQQKRWDILGMSLSSPVYNTWGQRLSVSRSNEEVIGLDNDTTTNRYVINSGITTVDWRHNISSKEGNILTIGYDWQQREGALRGVYDKSLSSQAFYLQDQRGAGTQLLLLAGVRWDSSTMFDDALTYRLGISYLPARSTKWYAQYSTGFKPPDLNALFWPGAGNPDLKTEKVGGWEIGAEQVVSDNLSMTLSYYENFFEDMIQWFPDSSGVWKPHNRAEAESKGVETEIKWSLSRLFRIEGNYTYNKTEDINTRFYLQRIPMNKYTLILRINPDGRLRFDFYYKIIGKRVEWTDTDSDGTPDQQTFLESYSRLDFVVSYRFRNTAEIFTRIENIYDVEYEEISGYSVPGYSTYGGLRISF